METYMTITEMAEYLRLSEQTIRRYVLNREIPYHKIKKVVRFRLSEIEGWIDDGGGECPVHPINDREGYLFTESEAGKTGADGETVANAETQEVKA
jgi:excisionase family DNA binding protein